VGVVVGYGTVSFVFPSCLPVFPCLLLLPGEGVPTRTLPFVRGRDIRTSAGNGSRLNGCMVPDSGYVFRLGLMGSTGATG